MSTHRLELSRFLMMCGLIPVAGAVEVPGPHDEALVLHTSGTTARPKIVPLTQQNLTASAANIGATLHLTSDDVGLNIMPLFHVHGLVAGLLAPLLVWRNSDLYTGLFSAEVFFCGSMIRSQPGTPVFRQCTKPS